MLRLSIATYRLPRVIRVGKYYSEIVVALRGITAGSGLATTEMLLIMLRIIKRALKAAPSIIPTLFVDDVSAECTGPDKTVKEQLGKFIKSISDSITASEMELSKKKSVFTANSDKLGKELEETWQDLGIKYQKYVKSLGVGMAAGRRNVRE